MRGLRGTNRNHLIRDLTEEECSPPRSSGLWLHHSSENVGAIKGGFRLVFLSSPSLSHTHTQHKLGMACQLWVTHSITCVKAINVFVVWEWQPDKLARCARIYILSFLIYLMTFWFKLKWLKPTGVLRFAKCYCHCYYANNANANMLVLSKTFFCLLSIKKAPNSKDQRMSHIADNLAKDQFLTCSLSQKHTICFHCFTRIYKQKKNPNPPKWHLTEKLAYLGLVCNVSLKKLRKLDK